MHLHPLAMRKKPAMKSGPHSGIARCNTKNYALCYGKGVLTSGASQPSTESSSPKQSPHLVLIAASPVSCVTAYSSGAAKVTSHCHQDVFLLKPAAKAI